MQPRCGALVGAVGIDPCEGRVAPLRDPPAELHF